MLHPDPLFYRPARSLPRYDTSGKFWYRANIRHPSVHAISEEVNGVTEQTMDPRGDLEAEEGGCQGDQEEQEKEGKLHNPRSSSIELHQLTIVMLTGGVESVIFPFFFPLLQLTSPLVHPLRRRELPPAARTIMIAYLTICPVAMIMVSLAALFRRAPLYSPISCILAV